MLKTLLIPDVHGDGDAAVRLMRAVGALDADYERVPGWRIIHLGDLLDGRENTRDADSEALALVENGTIDILLVGNHEYPFFGGDEFYGFAYDANIAARLEVLRNEGRLLAAYAIGNKLLTHAGVAPYWGERFGWRNAYDAAKEINAEFLAHPYHSLFSQIGKARGGLSATGGILWSDYSEPRYLAHFNQIHGHTFVGPDRKFNPVTRHWALVLDNGGGKFANSLAGAIVEGNGVEIVESGRREPDFCDPLFDLDAYADELASSRGW